MDNQDILQRIQKLVDEEHQLRQAPSDDVESRRERLRRVGQDLDQCWDLLRQRRAMKDAGGNPADAGARPIDQVEGYRQ
ncbi:DUF2630 family protein [Arthrobacter sp. H20]|uniref:DUF2630 family protein n=1 Tax=Arthrobacter sp. H20 TaxID=1267981 RepID=UPI00047EC79B|nr:DUF2630 family protein [Arthrobacter sp. H20]